MTERAPEFGNPGTEYHFGAPHTLRHFYHSTFPISEKQLAAALREAVAKLLLLPPDHPFRSELEEAKRIAKKRMITLDQIGLPDPDYYI